MAYKLSENSKMNRSGADKKLIEISDLAITLTLVDFGHPKLAGKRSAEEQHNLWLDDMSQCDGYTKISKHQLGKALDFYAFVNGKASWYHPHLAMVATAHFQAASILGYRIKWGGLWKPKKPEIVDDVPYGWDCPHIELIGN